MAPEISIKGNFSLDNNGRFYSTTKVYGYVKMNNCPLSYEFLLGLLNSSLFWFFIKNTGYVLRGGYFTFKTNYVLPFPIPDINSIDIAHIRKIEKIVNDIHSIKRNQGNCADVSTELEQIDEIVLKIYGINEYHEMINKQ